MSFVVNCSAIPKRFNGDREAYLAHSREYQRKYRLANLAHIKQLGKHEVEPRSRHRAKRKLRTDYHE